MRERSRKIGALDIKPHLLNIPEQESNLINMIRNHGEDGKRGISRL